MPSEKAAFAAEFVFAKAPEDYWDFHHGLFGEQDSDNHHSNWLTDEVISDMLERHTSLNADDVLSDINNESYRAELDHDEQMISEYGVHCNFFNNVNFRLFDYISLLQNKNFRIIRHSVSVNSHCLWQHVFDRC